MTQRRWTARQWTIPALLPLLPLAGTPVSAQVVLDGTVGPSWPQRGPAVTLPGPDYVIEQSMGRTVGRNLFHSFREFGLTAADVATFRGADIDRIISRVTGGNPSRIEGRLVSEPAAGFYFINPNGVVFGETASLAINGPFHVTTADALRLRDGVGVFFADPSAPSVLTTAPPAAFGFLRPEPATVTFEGVDFYSTPPVPEGAAFEVIAGDIRFLGATFGSAMAIPGGRVTLVSVASAGDAGIVDGGVDVSGFGRLGTVEVTGGSLLEVTGERAGDVYVRAGQLHLEDSAILAYTLGGADGGAVDLGVSGDITVATGGLEIGGAIIVGTEGPGAAPAVRLTAGGAITVSGAFSGVFSDRFFGAPAPAVEIRGGRLVVRDGAAIQTTNYDLGRGADLAVEAGSVEIRNGSFVGTDNFGPGESGTTTLRANSVLIDGQGSTDFTGLTASSIDGAAGDIFLETETLSLQGGFARISAEASGTGNAGVISVRASRSVEMAGETAGIYASALNTDPGAGNAGTIIIESPEMRVSGAKIDSRTQGPGDAGLVDVSVDRLTLQDGAQIRSFSGTLLDTGEFLPGGGRAGEVRVTARESAQLTGTGSDGAPSGLLSQTRGPGAGGDVRLATPLLTMANGTLIGADTGGDGNAGAVYVEVDRASLTGGARISSDSGIRLGGLDLVGSGEGGGVKVVAREGLDLSGSGTRISTQTRGAGSGGVVTLQAGTLRLSGGAAVSADTFGSGNAGTVVLGGDFITFSGAGTRVSTGTSASGRGGDVEISGEQLTIASGASVSASSTGTGLAGNIGIRLGDSLTMQGGSVTTQAVTSDGGNITITAPRLIHLRDSQITTSVESGAGGGGNIFIDPQFVVLQNSQIIANAFGGPGGNIRIVAGQLIADPSTLISASSALGIDGTVNIDAPDTNVSSALVALPESYLDASSLLQPSCGAARAGLSSLVEVGRGGLPPDPDGYLWSVDVDTKTVAPASRRTAARAAANPFEGALAFAVQGCRR